MLWSWGWKEETECKKGTFGGNRSILYLGCSHYMTVGICQNSPKCILRLADLSANHTSIKMILLKFSHGRYGSFQTCLQYSLALLPFCILLESGLCDCLSSGIWPWESSRLHFLSFEAVVFLELSLPAERSPAGRIFQLQTGVKEYLRWLKFEARTDCNRRRGPKWEPSEVADLQNLKRWQ